jgi:hypothetical protein
METIQIKVECADDKVWDLIGQDPMDMLDKTFPITINGHKYVGRCEGYISDGSTAKLTIYADPKGVV